MPTSWQAQYNQATNDARQQLINQNTGVPQSAVNQLTRYLAEAIRDIEQQAGTGLITAGRAEQLRGQILEILARMDLQVERVMDQQLRRALSLATDGHRSGLNAVSRSVGVPAQADLRRVPELALSVMATRRGLDESATLKTLIRRRIASMQTQVDSFLGSVVSRGISAGQATKELAAIMSEGQPQLIRALETVSNRKIHSGLLEEALMDMPGQYLQQFDKLKSLVYDSRRIVVSEINNAYAEADRIASAQSVVVDLLKWEVSSRHWELRTTPDVCTFYYDQDFQGLGAGIYTPETMPGLPHAHCGCYSSKVYRPPAQWDKPKQPARPARRISFNEMRSKYSNETDNFIKRQVDTANTMNELAWRAFERMN